MRSIMLFCIAAMVGTSVSAQETKSYTYDALGRLVQTTTAGGPGNGVAASITYDPAGNRAKYNVSGATTSGTATGSNGSGAAAPQAKRMVILPLNGFTLLPVG